MFLRFGVLAFGLALCFAHNGECNEGETLSNNEWPLTSGEYNLPAALPVAERLTSHQQTFQQTSSGLPLSPAMRMSNKPFVSRSSIGTKGRETVVQEQAPLIQETVEAPIKGGLSRSFPTKGLPPVVQQQQVIEEPIRSYPTKGGPVVQEQVQEVRSQMPVKGLPPVQVQEEIQEQLPVAEPIRSYPVKGQVQEVLQAQIPERVLPVKGQVIQEQAPIQETIVREEQAQLPLATKGSESRIFSQSIASPMFAAPTQLRSYGARALNLPAQADSVIASGISFSFSCENMPYGYYADVLNNCQVYHICKPIINNGLQSMQRFSFFCPQGTFFDQIKHVCMSANSADLTPCHLASNYFGHTVARFAAPMTYNTYATQMLPAASAMRSTIVSGKGVLPARKGFATPLENFRTAQTVQEEVAIPQQQELLPVAEPLPLVQQSQQFESLRA